MTAEPTSRYLVPKAPLGPDEIALTFAEEFAKAEREYAEMEARDAAPVELVTPAYPVCPECLLAGRGGARLTVRRDTCRTCNRYAMQVYRATNRVMREAYYDEYKAIEKRIYEEMAPSFLDGVDWKGALARVLTANAEWWEAMKVEAAKRTLDLAERREARKKQRQQEEA